jgi:hypothetical protein
MDATDPTSWRRQRGWPAWLLSAVLHGSVLVSLGLVVGRAPEGAADEPARSGGIVLASREAGKTQYFEGDSPAAGGAASSAAIQAACASRW